MLRYLGGLRAAPSPESLFVIGNSSADMDSCCCALAGAFLLHALQPTDGRPVVPVLNVSRQHLKLRQDVEWLFHSLGIHEANLVFRDELGAAPDRRLLLVDHNVQTEKGTVEGIIDHHEPEGLCSSAGKDPYIIRPAGSCSSLIVDYFRQHVPSTVWEDPALLKVCTAPILLDTKNMKHKVEQVDVDALRFLEQQSQRVPGTMGLGETGQAELYEALKRRKSDITGLSSEDLLNKDFKRWGGIGISSLPVSLAKIEKSHPDFAATMVQWRSVEQLDVLVVLSSGKRKGVYAREFAIVNEGPLSDAAASFPSLELKELHTRDGVTFYNQGNINATRKQVAPLLRALLE